MNILFLNHKIENCGVYQYGKRLFEILEKDNEINYIYKEIDSYEEYKAFLEKNQNISSIIYNYNNSTMNWLNKLNIQKKVKNIGLLHESHDNFFDIHCNLDPNAPEDLCNLFSIPRPIYENIENIIKTPIQKDSVSEFIQKYTDSDIPIFGSFGFGFENKGFHNIVKMVNEQYDIAVIKFVIPIAHYDPDPSTIYRMRDYCLNANYKPGIILMITHEFFSTTDILKFLYSNTMNIFLYDFMNGRGISSAIDYAISVKKPIAISDSFMFRNIYSDDICLYKNTIEYCINNSEDYLKQFHEKYSHENVISCFRKILN